MRKIYNYKVSGYIMKKNQETWEMERNSFISKVIALSRLKDIITNEDREFFECEIALQFKYDYFELDGFELNN
jgi:Na+-transporting NADH:ubiquinone oxidoreductase subunit NqrF